ncbi:hypothetical protein C7293_17425 [filamentous cyanobacterium CCT1]|nr:hypothetical protein C7293_17425 [filamentous cyanobacterium CCT1]PSN76797.1 hypothetical protein C8B47_25465 [filamentous cyanobacterium CCP4]
MPYRTLLYPWCIVRLLPQLQRVTVARFRNRSQAENHLKVLRRLMPAGTFVIVFDPPAPPLPKAKITTAHAID